MSEHRRESSVIAMTAALFVGLAGPAWGVDDLSLNVVAGSETVAPGDTVNVTLDAANLSTAINGVQALLHYDNTLLNLLDIVPTDLGLTPPSEGWVEVYLADTNGDIEYAIAVNGGSSFAAGPVATLIFEVLVEGVTNVTFRADADPFFTKLTAAGNNTTVFPNTFASGSITLQCDDELFCNGLEVFVAGVCQPGSDPCDDGISCTDETCDEVADACTSVANDANCPDDGLYCNGTAFCDATLDCSNTGDPCDDGISCTDETCDEIADACTSVANDANCPDDGLYCTGTEYCDATLDCTGTGDPCDDGIGCTDDVCNDVFDTCTNTANDANCDDGLYCNGAETCDAALDCQPGTDPCDDSVGCTDDSCDDATDTCTNTPNDGNCPDDGLFCTGDEICDAVGDCVSTGDPCTPLHCDEVSDVCSAPIHVANLEVFYTGRFGACVGGNRPGLDCSADLDCVGTYPIPDGVCTPPEQPDPSRSFLGAGAALFCVGGGNDALPCTANSDCNVCVGGIDDGLPCSTSSDCSGGSCPRGACASSNLDNITNYVNGITGIRVFFDNVVAFATTAQAAFNFEWSEPPRCVGGTQDGTFCNSDNPGDPCVVEGGMCEVHIFSPVTDAATAITVTPMLQGSVTVVEVVLDDDHVRKRWLKVTIDATQVTVTGIELDGEIAGNPAVLPSGDGTPGGDAVFYLGNMPGDVDGNRKTELNDPFVIRNCGDLCFNPFLFVPITELLDIDKDVKVRLQDVYGARVDVNPFLVLPLLSP